VIPAGDGFLTRWARRKAEARGGAPAAEASPAAPAAGDAGEAPLPTLPGLAPAATPAPGPAQPTPLPTLDDVARLTHASDFSPYVARNVDAGVRNAAMKKLFSDPHFNVMDGLDTYIDDYGKPDPIPLAMLRKMNQSAVLGLFADELDPALPKDATAPAPAEASPDGAGAEAMAQSPQPAPRPQTPPAHADDDPDLQLQPDDADRRPGPGPGARR
jgi:hypothetical protein